MFLKGVTYLDLFSDLTSYQISYLRWTLTDSKVKQKIVFNYIWNHN